jgi:hypothetical protein
MSIQVGQTSFGNKTRALRTLVYVAAIVVFAVLNPLACVWHCALHDLMMEHAAHNQRHVWICTAHADDPAVGSTNASGSIQLTGAGTTIAAVHHAVLLGIVSLTMLVIVSSLGSSSPRRGRSTPLVPTAPPPKYALHYV